MSIVALDIGGTKISGALFSEEGEMLIREKRFLEGREGDEVGMLATELILEILSLAIEPATPVKAAGICIPGIVDSKTDTVWAPNIPGWDHFPLKGFIQQNPGMKNIDIHVESDRTCHVLGEIWKGAARGCSNVVLIAVGTGIGVGIYLDGRILHGGNDIIGAAGWMALEPPYASKYDACGCFEYYASGSGIAARARDLLWLDSSGRPDWGKNIDKITAQDVFTRYSSGDPLAVSIIGKAVEMWGMASANIVSLLNPEKVIWGGGVFGPAIPLVGEIYREALRWAQPVSIRQVQFVPAGLGPDAGLYGAAKLAL